MRLKERKIKHLKWLIHLIILLTVIGIDIGPINIVRGQVSPLRAVFNPPECSRACFFGIQPGITTRTQLYSLLSASGIPYEEIPSALGLESTPETTPVFWRDNRAPSVVNTSWTRVVAYFVDNVVHGLVIPMVESPVSTIITEYGMPQQLYSLGERHFRIVYASSGIAFNFDSAEDRVYQTHLFSDTDGAAFYIVPPDDPILVTDCIEVDPQCTLVTATPMPTHTPTPTATFTPTATNTNTES
jgi:hypothetical protein